MTVIVDAREPDGRPKNLLRPSVRVEAGGNVRDLVARQVAPGRYEARLTTDATNEITARLLDTSLPATAGLSRRFVPDAGAFKSGREFAAWVGLVPRQQSSGGKERLGGHTKMGDAYLCRLLISGAQAVISHAKRRKDIGETWIGKLLSRKPTMVAAVAQANKTARIAWAIMARGETYRATA